MMRSLILRTGYKSSTKKPTLYILAGQGTQQKNMLLPLLSIPQCKSQIESLSHSLDIDFTQISTTDSKKQINKTSITQPLLVLSHVLRWKYLVSRDLGNADFMIGHSVGEYSALCIAGSIGLLDCLKLVRKRGLLMEEVTKEPSGMLIVRYADNKKQEVMQIIKQHGLQIACYNTPNNLNIAGPTKSLTVAHTTLKCQKITTLFLPVSSAFHCSLLQPMIPLYSSYLQCINFKSPQCQILRNLDTKIYQDDIDIKEGLVQHLVNPVRFWEAVVKVDLGVPVIEIGHNGVVGKFVEETRRKIMQDTGKVLP